MSKTKKSGAAIFMYLVIAATVLISAICFILYYGNILKSSLLLWIGIVAFMIMYHFWLRIIMGNVSKLFKVSYHQWWFKERFFEKKLYQLLLVKKWKGKALTYNPEHFNLRKHSLTEVAQTMTKAELDHWINEIISVSSLLFSLLWGQFWIFFATAIFAMLFDAQFILIQRYNRPRVLALIDKQKLIRTNFTQI